MNVELRSLPPDLYVIPWIDHDVERVGFYPLSQYVEVCYLPVLGPTATFLYRRLGTAVGQYPEGVEFDSTDLAVSLGVGEGIAKNSPIARAVGRLVSFAVAEWQDEALAVRRALSPLPAKRAERLSYSASEAHKQLMEGKTRS